MGDHSMKIGQTVLSQDGRQGVVRFVGNASFAKGEWIGLELPDNNGKNDGSVNGERYFRCQPGFGIFVRPESIVEVLSQPPLFTNGKVGVQSTSGVSTKARPSSGITADTARKRQSLMGSNSTSTSRLSIRSPTKSPTKPLASSNSSGASTPRTGTPTTNARTSDSSVKSRLSTSSRPSMGPPPSKPNTTKPIRQSLSANHNKSIASGAPTPASRSGPTSRESLSARQTLGIVARTKASEAALSAPIHEEGEYRSAPILNGDDYERSDPEAANDKRSLISGDAEVAEPEANMTSEASRGRTPAQGSFESRAAVQREMEQLKAKNRTLEQGRLEDRDKVKSLDGIKAERDRFHTIIQTLQHKLHSIQSEMTELRDKCKDAEARASLIDREGGEHDTELEMARLDKEMSDERAESYKTELDALKIKHEELELNLEILREENKEISSGMSLEEKASAGWVQMEREKERLRRALISLRDMSQQTEGDLKTQVKELQRDLRDCDEISSKYQVVSEKLAQSEANQKHLVEQLEAAESQEEVNLGLESQKEEHLRQIEELKAQLVTLQDEARVNDELDHFHIDMEREMQEELDTRQALLNEKDHASQEQNKIIEDLEYTLAKFREVVIGLEKDINDLRVSRNISESEASEMNNKSRALIDLNLKLQNSANKTQLKTIDLELGRMEAEESAQHLSITQMFVSENYEMEEGSIQAFLCFKRIDSKASLVHSILRDRSKDNRGSTVEDQFALFSVMENLSWISACCGRFAQFMSGCTSADFGGFGKVILDLEPVERVMNNWIAVLRRDEIHNTGSAADLERMVAIVSDLAEKFITSNLESKTDEMIARTTTLEKHLDIITAALSLLSNIVLSALGDRADNEDFQYFGPRMNQFTTRSRTMRYMTSKVLRELRELKSRTMAITEGSWSLFEQADDSARELSELVRQIGREIVPCVNVEEPGDPLTCSVVLDLMKDTTTAFLQTKWPDEAEVDDALARIGSLMQQLHSKVEKMQNTVTDLSKTSEFERRPPPWVVRSKEFKERTIIPADTDQQLRRLKVQTQDQMSTLASKDRELEEHRIKIELLNSRVTESRHHTAAIQKVEAELETVWRAKNKVEADLERALNEHKHLSRKREEEKAGLDVLKKAGLAGDHAPPTPVVREDQTMVLQLTAEINILRDEIASLQSAVRYLKADNYPAKIPASLSKTHSWLDASTLARPRGRDRLGAAERKRVFDRRLEVMATAKPLILKSFEQDNKTSWRATRSTPRYQAVTQREEFERWADWKNSVVKRARVIQTTNATSARPIMPDTGLVSAKKPFDDSAEPGTPRRSNSGHVRIVGSPP